jgi:tRNA wybutosine-synthesizing protein 3
MSFSHQKNIVIQNMITQDKSKKGSIDTHAIPFITTINSLENYYTTSSCSGRIYFWQGGEKKCDTEWLNVSHELITSDFFNIQPQGTVWLRMEPFIIHIACKDIESANTLLQTARNIFKKSSILSINRKIIIEIQGSDKVDMPFYENSTLVYTGNQENLMNLLNAKLQKTWDQMEQLRQKI